MDVAPAAGTLEVALVDGSGAVVNDDAGNANSFTVNLVTLGTTFVPKGGAFRVPNLPPTTLRLRLRLSVALSIGSKVFLDRLALAAMTPIQGRQATSACLFSGNVPLLLGDSWTITTTNDRAGVAREWTQRWFDMRSLGQLFPTSAGPTISDGLFS